jgi:hypothetical protein
MAARISMSAFARPSSPRRLTRSMAPASARHVRAPLADAEQGERAEHARGAAIGAAGREARGGVRELAAHDACEQRLPLGPAGAVSQDAVQLLGELRVVDLDRRQRRLGGRRRGLRGRAGRDARDRAQRRGRERDEQRGEGRAEARPSGAVAGQGHGLGPGRGAAARGPADIGRGAAGRGRERVGGTDVANARARGAAS